MTHGDTQDSVNKQKNNILNPTPSGDRNYQLILAAHKRCLMEENLFVLSLCFFLTVISAEQFIVPQKYPQKESTKSVHKKCAQKVCTKSPHKKCPNEVFTTSVKKCSQNVSTK